MKNPLTIFLGTLAAAAVVAVVVYFTVFAAGGDITTKRIAGYASPLNSAPQLQCSGPQRSASLAPDRGTLPDENQVAATGRDLLPEGDGADVYEVVYDTSPDSQAMKTRVVWLTTERRAVGTVDAERTRAGGPWRLTAVISC
jgi:hypothetical protein